MSSLFTALRTGPKLAKRLASVELRSLSDEQLLDYLHAEVRQLASQQARVWAAMAEVGRRAPLPFDHSSEWTPERVSDSAACEIVAELRVSKPYAEHELDHAQRIETMPSVAAALRAGNIDRNRVLVLLDVCADLSEDHRDQLITEVLPSAGSLPPGTLRNRAQRLAIALDPEWAEKRYRAALTQQRVVRFIADDGTVTIAGENLDANQALPAMQHVTALAKAAQRAGAKASRDLLRATLFTGLLGTRFLGLTQRQIIAELVAQFPKPSAEAAPPEPVAKPEPVASTGVELRVGVATLMGLAEEPGEVAGAGPVIAPVARDIAQTQRRGEWRFAIIDQHGMLLHEGITRHRPTGYPTGGATGGIVEIHVPTGLLDPAFIDEHPTWAKLLTDLASKYARQAPIEQDPAARLPGARLRRRMQIRHRWCVFPGCRRPAADSQTDHRHDHAKGGLTLEQNLETLCEHHHDLKTRWGWRLIRRDDQTYVWISPLGRRHLVAIEPVAPPLPIPRDDLTEQDPDPPDTAAA